MKISILLVGEYRTFPYCRKNMAFLDQRGSNVDVYFSTWNTTSIINPLVNSSGTYINHNVVNITEQEIRNVLGIPLATVKLHTLNKYDLKDRFSLMIKGWQLGFNLIKSSGKYYDYIMILRPDMFFKNHTEIDLTLLPQYISNIGLQYTPDQKKIAADTMMFSSYSNIDKILKPENISKLNNRDKEIHEEWYEYLLENKLGFKLMPLIDNTGTYDALIARYPMDHNDSWETVSNRYWRIFHGTN